MHEVSIADALLSQVAAEAARHGIGTVRAVGVCVGRRSGVAAESLAQAFAILRDGSPAAGASLDVQTVDGTDLRLEWIEGE
jgi:Zn finger protein HypA/HybF involved in hydrogenase expression